MTDAPDRIDLARDRDLVGRGREIWLRRGLFALLPSRSIRGSSLEIPCPRGVAVGVQSHSVASASMAPNALSSRTFQIQLQILPVCRRMYGGTDSFSPALSGETRRGPRGLGPLLPSVVGCGWLLRPAALSRVRLAWNEGDGTCAAQEPYQ